MYMYIKIPTYLNGDLLVTGLLETVVVDLVVHKSVFVSSLMEFSMY